MKPSVSLIIPVYNAARHLPAALDCALSQTLDDIEIVCVDDGSTDSSANVLDAFADKDDRVRVISQENQGAGAARNAGIEAAEGMFLAFLDADDLLGSNDYLESLYRATVNHDMPAAAGSLLNMRGLNRLEDASGDPLYGGYSFAQEGVVEYRDYQFDYGFTRFLFSRSLFEDGDIRFNGLRHFEDPVFLTRALYRAERFYALPRTAYWYRCESKPQRWDTRKVCDLLEGVRMNLEFSAERGLAKLHWYTAHHLDEAAHYAGVGFDHSLDESAIVAELEKVETALDRGLLASVDPSDADFVPEIRRDLDANSGRGRVALLASSMRFRSKRALAPLYHRIAR